MKRHVVVFLLFANNSVRNFPSLGGCRHQSGQVSWEEFVRLFELIEDRTGDGGIAALNPDIKEVIQEIMRLIAKKDSRAPVFSLQIAPQR